MHLNYVYFRSCSLHVPACFSNSFSMSFHTFPLLRTVHFTTFFEYSDSRLGSLQTEIAGMFGYTGGDLMKLLQVMTTISMTKILKLL